VTAVSVKICTASGFCMTCDGTLDSAKKAIKGADNFICCGKKCIRKTDISTIEELMVRPPDDGDDGDDKEPVGWGWDEEPEASRD
jgi:hypothetical protein